MPLDTLGRFGNIVVRHPEGIFVEALVGEYVAAETIAAIDDGLHA